MDGGKLSEVNARLVAPFVNSLVTLSLSCVHKHLLSSDWERRPCQSKYLNTVSVCLCVPDLLWSLQFLVRVFTFLSLNLFYSLFSISLFDWDFQIEEICNCIQKRPLYLTTPWSLSFGHYLITEPVMIICVDIVQIIIISFWVFMKYVEFVYWFYTGWSIITRSFLKEVKKLVWMLLRYRSIIM